MSGLRATSFKTTAIGQAVLALMLLLVVGSCGGVSNKPYAKLDGSPEGKPAPPLTLTSIIGIPQDKVQPFKDALSASAGRRDIAIVEGAFETGSLGLAGNFDIQPAGADVRLVYDWTLSDKAGTVLHKIAADEKAPAVGGDPWAAVTTEVLQRVAAYTAESLSSRLSQLGYATQVGGLPPPLDSFVLAQPGAEKDIDYETLHGPGRVDPAELAAMPPEGSLAETGSIDKPDADTAVAAAEPPSEAAKAKEEQAAKAAKADYQIKAVAVIPVKGSPGSGNAELTRAMRETLKLAGWPVISAPRADALTIKGKVKVSAVAGDTQKVSLAWTITAPNGKVLGTISQSNMVPAGAIDLGWGDSAIQVAEAAALGIFDLVKQLR
jgi:hypothetical protein